MNTQKKNIAQQSTEYKQSHALGIDLREEGAWAWGTNTSTINIFMDQWMEKKLLFSLSELFYMKILNFSVNIVSFD